MPPDLLLAALGDVDHGPERVEWVAPSLNQYLRQYGYAETHLHLGAALEFSHLWAAAVAGVADPRHLHLNSFRSAGADLDEALSLSLWLVRAAIARHLLAEFLSQRQSGDDFADYLARRVAPWTPTLRALLLEGLSDLRRGHLADPDNSFA